MARAPSIDSTWIGTLDADVAVGGTSCDLVDATGTNWPSGSGIFGIQIGEDPDDDAELVQVTRSSTTLTLDSSTPTLTKAHTAGANVYYLTTAPDINAKLDASYLDTDGTLAANSDSKVATQKAVKAYADLMVPKAGGSMTGTLVGKNGTATDTSMGPRSNQFGWYSTASTLLAASRAGQEAFVVNPVNFDVNNQALRSAKGFQSNYYTAGKNYVASTALLAAAYIGTLAVDYTPGDGVMYMDDVSVLDSAGVLAPFSFTMDGGTNWYVCTAWVTATGAMTVRNFIGTDTAYYAGASVAETSAAYGYDNIIIPTTGAPYTTLATALTGNIDAYLPPRLSLGVWTKPSTANEYGVLADNVSTGVTVTVKDGYDGREISQMTGGAASHGVGTLVKFDGSSGYFPVGAESSP